MRRSSRPRRRTSAASTGAVTSFRMKLVKGKTLKELVDGLNALGIPVVLLEKPQSGEYAVSLTALVNRLLDKLAPRRAEQDLSSGIRAYEDGDYKNSVRLLPNRPGSWPRAAPKTWRSSCRRPR